MSRPTLQDFYFQMAPELATVRFSDETAANCGACPMQQATSGPHGSQRVFHAKPRCCTYHPRLPNFMVGRVLRRGDVGAEKMLARMRNLDGVTEFGVSSDRESAAYYEANKGEFGRMPGLICPYWSDGTVRGCTIHRDRNAVCRTWHCKHVEGMAGQKAWMKVKDVLSSVENLLTRAAIAAGQPPAEGSDRDAWIRWYLWCATWVEELGPEGVHALRSPELESRLAALRGAVRVRDDVPMPDVLGANVSDFEIVGDIVRMSGYSNYDTHDLPRHVFAFLSRLDGETTWWEALVAAEAEVGEKIGADLVRLMWRHGMLGVPMPTPPPGMTARVMVVDESAAALE